MEVPSHSESIDENLDSKIKGTTKNKLEQKLDFDERIKAYKTEENCHDNANDKKKVSSDYTPQNKGNVNVNENKIFDSAINTPGTSKEINIELSKELLKSSPSHFESSNIDKETCIEGLSDHEGGHSSFVPPRMLMSACSMTTSYNSEVDDLSMSQFSEDLSSGKFDTEYGEFDSLENKEESHSLENPEELNFKENDTDNTNTLKENNFESQKREGENNDLSEGGKKKKRRKKKNKNKVESQGTEEEVKKINIRPNYFVGIQISNPKIHEAIVKVQEDLLIYENNIYRALVDVATAHITLLVAYLPDETAVALNTNLAGPLGKQF
ncbi:unnamed protein product, partial [Meganyctiphanes norvegica]